MFFRQLPVAVDDVVVRIRGKPAHIVVEGGNDDIKRSEGHSERATRRLKKRLMRRAKKRNADQGEAGEAASSDAPRAGVSPQYPVVQ